VIAKEAFSGLNHSVPLTPTGAAIRLHDEKSYNALGKDTLP
jgi:hypothetical protein